MFISQLDLAPVPHTESWMLMQKFIYETSEGEFIVVPKGFLTDFASIPRLFWNILPPTDHRIREASVIHDWLYTNKVEFSRKEADMLLRSIMVEELGASKWLAAIVYYSVRMFGGSHWKD